MAYSKRYNKGYRNQKLIKCKIKIDKKTREETAASRGYLDLKPSSKPRKLMLDVCACNKEGYGHWIKVTELSDEKDQSKGF